MNLCLRRTCWGHVVSDCTAEPGQQKSRQHERGLVRSISHRQLQLPDCCSCPSSTPSRLRGRERIDFFVTSTRRLRIPIKLLASSEQQRGVSDMVNSDKNDQFMPVPRHGVSSIGRWGCTLGDEGILQMEEGIVRSCQSVVFRRHVVLRVQRKSSDIERKIATFFLHRWRNAVTAN